MSVPTGLEPLLKRLWRALDPAFGSNALGLLFRLGLPLALLALVWRSRRRDEARPHAAPALRLVGWCAAGLLAFLAFMTVRYNWDGADWSYLDEGRYYRPLLPAFLLAWLILLDRLRGGARRAAVLVLSLSIVYVLQAQVRFEAGRLRGPDESWELVERVRALEREPGLHVVLDNDVSDYVLTAGGRLLARRYPAPETVARLKVGRPARLWLVRRLREPSPYVLDRDFDRKRFSAVTARFPAERVWVSSGGAYELYRAEIAPAP